LLSPGFAVAANPCPVLAEASGGAPKVVVTNHSIKKGDVSILGINRSPPLQIRVFEGDVFLQSGRSRKQF
jgi:hypothetical protein